MLELSSKVITVVTPAIVMISILMEWAYFSVVGANFFRILTISDHIVNILADLPVAIVLMTIFVCATALRQGVNEFDRNFINRTSVPQSKEATDQYMSIFEIEQRRLRERRMHSLRVTGFSFVVILTIIFGLMFVAMTAFESVISRIILLVSAAIFLLCLISSLSILIRNYNFNMVFGVFLIIMAALSYGILDVYIDINKTPRMTIILKNGEMMVSPLRFTEHGIIVYVPDDRKVQFINWDGISGVIEHRS